MERMLRVQTAKAARPVFNSLSPERRRKARREGLWKRKARWGAKSRKGQTGVCVSCECCWQAVWCSEEWVGCEWLQEDDVGERRRNEERKKKSQE